MATDIAVNMKPDQKSPPEDLKNQQTGDQLPGRQLIGSPWTPGAVGGWNTWAVSGGQLYFGNGGTFSNPMNFPGWGAGYSGTYTVYRWMLQHPVIRLVRAICTDIILSSYWEYEPIDPDDDVPQRWRTLAKRVFNPLRRSLLKNFFVRGKDLGWACGEPIWEQKGNYMIIKKVKPLLQDVSQVLQNEYGEYVGIRNFIKPGPANTASAGGHVDLVGPYKSFVYTFDGEAGNPYGRPWLENIRTTAWADWMDCAQQLARLGAKISGVVTIVKSPAGTFPGPTDKNGQPTQVSYRENAETVIKSLANGAAGVWFPSLALAADSRGGIDALKLLAELAKTSLTNIEVVDFGSNAAAIGPILERMKHAEELIFAGGLRSSRTGLEGTHGTKEEAGVHTDTGTITSESEDEDFAEACQPLLDALMEVNFGPSAVGRLRIKTPSLVDRKAQVLRSFLLALMNNPKIVEELGRTADITKIIQAMDIPNKKEFDGGMIKEDEPKSSSESGSPQEKNKQVDPEGGRPKKED